MDPHGDIAALIESVEDRIQEDLFTRSMSECWPGGPSDSIRPGALEWVRRWGPGGSPPAGRACSCRAGRCSVCN
jgi:hypothetical protein